MAEMVTVPALQPTSQRLMTYTLSANRAASQRLMTYSGPVARTRGRDAARPRADLLAAARRRFGSDGYERTTVRAIAAEVGVDPALVIRYFGSKQELFAVVADLNLDLDLTTAPPGHRAEALLARFFAVWEDD